MPISLDKIERSAPGLVSLVKEASSTLGSAGLGGQAAKVALCLDFSASMRPLYKDHTVQRLAERVLALGTQFDDDGAIDIFLFASSAWYAGELTIDDYQGGVDRLTAKRSMGTTDYAGAMSLVRQHYSGGGGKRGRFRRKASAPAEGPADIPAYVLFLTDGAPDSEAKATRQLVEASREGVFWQFIGVGKADFSYLRRLDDQVPGRLIDNAGFFEVADLKHLSDRDLFAKMLAEFPGWLPQARAHGLIA